MKIALVHDSLTQEGGAEQVLRAMHEIFPEAPVFTLVLDRSLAKNYKGWDIRTSFLQRIYNFFPKFQYLLPIIPCAISRFNFEGFDVLLSDSSGFAKNIKLPKNCIHINYCHTPARFLWFDKSYLQQETPKIFQPLAKIFLNWMKKWDLQGSKRVNYFLANSHEVQNRIFAVYQRDCTVIHPGIDAKFWHKTMQKQNYFLIVGRLQAHKKNDFVIKCFNEMGLPLNVVGTGRQEKFLKSIAKPNIKFLGKVTNQELRNEYSGAKAVIYPQVEDFGLVPLEAAACGTPTIAFGKGGALETVIPGVTGEFFQNYDAGEFKRAVLAFNPNKYSTASLREQAENFSQEVFKEEIRKFVEKIRTENNI